MEPLRQCHPFPATKDLQLLLQFGIRQNVQIRLVKLKVDVYNSGTKLKSKSVETKLQPKSCHSRRKTKTEEIIKQFKCHLCNYSGAKRHYLTSHLRIHSDERPFKCTTCAYKGLTQEYLKTHLLTHQDNKSYTCQFCTKEFTLSSHKNVHEKRCRKNPKHSDAKWLEENKRHKCHLCKFVSWDSANLRIHLRLHFGQKPFACNFCAYKCCTQGSLNRHIFIHTKEKPFKCLQCDYSTSSASNLKIHAKFRHCNEIPNKNFPCNLCPRKFYFKPTLYTHILSHTGETPFVCQFCGRGFNMNSNKARHEKTCQNNPKQKDTNWVEEQKVFKCELCQYSSVHKYNLNMHVRSHTGSKPFHCSQCSFRSSSSSYLSMHSQQQHEEQKPFKCPHCNYGSVTSSILKRHISHHHS